MATMLILTFKKNKTENFSGITLPGNKYGVTAKIGMHGKQQEYD